MGAVSLTVRLHVGNSVLLSGTGTLMGVSKLQLDSYAQDDSQVGIERDDTRGAELAARISERRLGDRVVLLAAKTERSNPIRGNCVLTYNSKMTVSRG